MKIDKSSIRPGMVMYGAECPGEVAPSRRDMIKKGMTLHADSGGRVLIKSAPRLPDLAPIAERIVRLQARVDEVLKALRK